MVSIDVLPTIGLVRCRSCRPVNAIVIIMYHSARYPYGLYCCINSQRCQMCENKIDNQMKDYCANQK